MAGHFDRFCRVIRRLRRRTRDARGVTMIELLATMSILGIVIGGLTGVFVSGSSAHASAQDRFKAQETVGVALAKLRRDTHFACRIEFGQPAGTSVTLWFGDQVARGANDPVGTCVHTAANAQYDLKVSWCTSGSGSRWALYRQTGATCSASSGEQWADYLTSGQAFSYVQAGPTTRARLHVDLPVNVRPDAVQGGRYHLADDIALLNTTRR